MRNNKYNLIHFSEKLYDEKVKMDIVPKPDSVLRVFMAYKPLKEKVEVRPQTFFKGFERKGFSVVEWGGTVVKNEDISYLECLINNKDVYVNACKIN